MSSDGLPTVASRPTLPGLDPFAGDCVPRWNSRFTHKVNRIDPAEHESADWTALQNTFIEPDLSTFLSTVFGERPCVLSTTIDIASSTDNGAGHATNAGPAVASTPTAPADWVRHTAYIAAGACEEDKAGNRLVIVDPEDPQRMRERDDVTQAFASAALIKDPKKRRRALAVSLYNLSKQYMLAVRDPHRDDEFTNTLRSKFSAMFQCGVTTNLYLSGARRAAGFVEHHDNHDVFAIQLQGRKRWHVGPPVLNHPSHRYRRPDSHTSDPAHMEVYDTGPGQILYMPAGWRHYAEPAAPESGNPDPHGRSVHLTMGVQVPRWLDVLETVPHPCGASLEWLRAPLPIAVHDGDGHGTHNGAGSGGGGGGDDDRGGRGGMCTPVQWMAHDLPSVLRRLADHIEAGGDGIPDEVHTACGATITLQK
eukprot:m.66727 g.66727  ORF g.66727 m.66727 type:complete len:422 (+) comp8382_c0_seq1:227-1492(+)